MLSLDQSTHTKGWDREGRCLPTPEFASWMTRQYARDGIEFRPAWWDNPVAVPYNASSVRVRTFDSRPPSGLRLRQCGDKVVGFDGSARPDRRAKLHAVLDHVLNGRRRRRGRDEGDPLEGAPEGEGGAAVMAAQAAEFVNELPEKGLHGASELANLGGEAGSAGLSLLNQDKDPHRGLHLGGLLAPAAGDPDVDNLGGVSMTAPLNELDSAESIQQRALADIWRGNDDARRLRECDALNSYYQARHAAPMPEREKPPEPEKPQRAKAFDNGPLSFLDQLELSCRLSGPYYGGRR